MTNYYQLDRFIYRYIALLLLLGFCSNGAFAADNFPSRPIKIVVPFAAGGGGDFLVRTWANKFSEILKQAVIIENRGGGNTVVGTELVAKATPDGYTLLFVSTSLATNPSLIKNLPYKTPGDFAPISLVLSYPFGLAIRNSLEISSIEELANYAKKNPGKLTIANSGDGSAAHLAAIMLEDALATPITHIAYRGAGLAMTDVAAGHVDLTFTGTSQIKPFLENKRVRLLASSGPKRFDLYPQVRTIAEQGLKGFNASVWWGLLAPAGTPKEIVEQLNQALRLSMNNPEVSKKIGTIDAELILSSSSEFSNFLQEEIIRWHKLLGNKTN